MLFHEPLFLFYVFPLFLVAFLAASPWSTARRWVLIAISLLFYTWGEPRFIPVVLISALADYGISLRLEPRNRNTGGYWLAVGILQNLAVLGFYKYGNFAVGNLDFVLTPLFGIQIPAVNVGLPIGISFITFEKISYLVDVRRGVTPAARQWRDYLLFVMLFPKLLAGPIMKYHEIWEQISSPSPPTLDRLVAGFERFALGVIKKLLIADPIAVYADQAFAPAATLGFGSAWLGLIAFTLQIYFDFSAYSDMAIGLARIFGFDLRENFAMPYLSRSLTEFWRRWHISLSTWVREYLYVPLGGNRDGTVLTYRNLWICFLASGLWHGASWTFVLWGAYNGLFLTLDRLFLLKVLRALPPAVANITTVLIVMFGWVLFRTSSIEHTGRFLAALANPFSVTRGPLISPEALVTMLLAVTLCVLPALAGFEKLLELNRTTIARSWMAIGLMLLFILACGRAGASNFTPFLYFRF